MSLYDSLYEVDDEDPAQQPAAFGRLNNNKCAVLQERYAESKQHQVAKQPASLSPIDLQDAVCRRS